MRLVSLFATTVASITLLATLSGCPAPPAPSSKTDTPGSKTETPPPTQDLPEYYRFPINTAIPTLDPALITDTVSSSIANQIFDGLVKIAPDGQLVNNIATEWNVDPTGLIYTFKLRTGVKFHNGREVTAEDFAYSFDRILNPATASPKTLFLDPLSGAKARMEGTAPTVSGIVVKDPTTLELHLDRPNALFPWYLAQSTCDVLPKEAVEDESKPWVNHPVGTGPFMLGPEEYNFNEGLTLVANPNYFNGAPKLKGIKYQVEKEEKKRFEGFRAGLYEHTDIPPDEMETVTSDPALKALLVERPTFDMYHISFNCDRPPFKDNPTLRKAFNYAVDKEYIAHDILKDTRVVCNSFLPVGFPNYTAPHGGYPYNVEKATALLKEAGYPNGQGLPTLTLWCNSDDTHKSIMTAVQNDLAKVGVTCELKTLEWASFLEAMDHGEDDFGQQTWLMDYPDPDNILYVLLDSKNKGAAGNHAFYGNPAFDTLVEQAQVEPDQAKRTALYTQAEQIAYDDAPWLLLFNRKCMILRQPYVTGLNLTTLDRAPVIPGVDMETVAFQ